MWQQRHQYNHLGHSYVRGDGHDDVGAYYDRNTRRFLRVDHGSGAMHRKLWPPEVHNAKQALLHLNRIILEIMERELGDPHTDPNGKSHSEFRIIDLGCGVGGTVLWLAGRVDARLIGITLSRVQAEIAREAAVRQGVAERCSFQVADVLDFQPDDPFHGALAVESFSHLTDAEGFFKQVKRILKRDGVLVLIDDVLEAGRKHPRAERWVRRFEEGWHLHGLTTVDRIVSCARRSGLTLIENRDLTHLIRVNPVLLFLLRPLLLLPIPRYFWDNVRGGIALQFCTRQGLTRYHCMIFRKE